LIFNCHTKENNFSGVLGLQHLAAGIKSLRWMKCLVYLESSLRDLHHGKNEDHNCNPKCPPLYSPAIVSPGLNQSSWLVVIKYLFGNDQPVSPVCEFGRAAFLCLEELTVARSSIKMVFDSLPTKPTTSLVVCLRKKQRQCSTGLVNELPGEELTGRYQHHFRLHKQHVREHLQLRVFCKIENCGVMEDGNLFIIIAHDQVLA
jgi:hypothetical protein